MSRTAVLSIRLSCSCANIEALGAAFGIQGGQGFTCGSLERCGMRRMHLRRVRAEELDPKRSNSGEWRVLLGGAIAKRLVEVAMLGKGVMVLWSRWPHHVSSCFSGRTETRTAQNMSHGWSIRNGMQCFGGSVFRLTDPRIGSTFGMAFHRSLRSDTTRLVF